MGCCICSGTTTRRPQRRRRCRRARRPSCTRSHCTVTARHKGGLRSSFRYAFAGLWWALTTQRNMRIHVAIGAAAFVLGVLLRLSTTELALVALTATVVLAAEMLNTVVEAAVDLARPTSHPLAPIAKAVPE